jgi:hypothetical protein
MRGAQLSDEKMARIDPILSRGPNPTLLHMIMGLRTDEVCHYYGRRPIYGKGTDVGRKVESQIPADVGAFH